MVRTSKLIQELLHGTDLELAGLHLLQLLDRRADTFNHLVMLVADRGALHERQAPQQFQEKLNLAVLNVDDEFHGASKIASRNPDPFGPSRLLPRNSTLATLCGYTLAKGMRKRRSWLAAELIGSKMDQRRRPQRLGLRLE